MNVKQIFPSIMYVLLVCCSFQFQQEEPYDYRTSLKGGYRIKFIYDQNDYHLFLLKQKIRIAEIAVCSRGLLYKNLGYVAADFNNYFVLAHSFGSNNPHKIELICKVTGKNIIPKTAAWIDAVEDKQILLYSTAGVPNEDDTMVLYNVLSGQKSCLHFPHAIFSAPEVLNRIHIKSFSIDKPVITYETESGNRLKEYNI